MLALFGLAVLFGFCAVSFLACVAFNRLASMDGGPFHWPTAIAAAAFLGAAVLAAGHAPFTVVMRP